MQLVIEGKDFSDLKEKILQLAQDVTAEHKYSITLKGMVNENGAEIGSEEKEEKIEVEKPQVQTKPEVETKVETTKTEPVEEAQEYGQLSEAARRYRETQTGEIDDGKAASKSNKAVSKKENPKTSKVKTKKNSEEDPQPQAKSELEVLKAEAKVIPEPKSEIEDLLSDTPQPQAQIGLGDLRVLLQQVFTTKGLSVAQGILGDFGFSALKQVPEELYQKVYEKCQGVLD